MKYIATIVGAGGASSAPIPTAVSAFPDGGQRGFYRIVTPGEVIMKLSLTVMCLFICAATSKAQSFDGDSVPEPTELSSAASGAGAVILAAGTPRRVESSNSAIELAAVEVRTADGESHPGIRLLLENSTDADRVYLNEAQAMQLRDELANFEGWLESTTSCSSRGYCVHGIARCRPSGSIPQAYCPAVYLTTEGERGVLLTTPRNSFRYPFTQIDALVDALDEVAVGLVR